VFHETPILIYCKKFRNYAPLFVRPSGGLTC
jgi:hypothetical protein